uniref:Glutathione peroxidase n=1 Tax=Chattonella marina var. antiqua TaxID=859642 RepID=A0A2Z5VKM7_CHAMQ|nr:glutathione peroxidase [Chattonella marina var. antiqua]
MSVLSFASVFLVALIAFPLVSGFTYNHVSVKNAGRSSKVGNMKGLLDGILGGGKKSSAESIFEFEVEDSNGKLVKLSDYSGKKKGFLVVNVASACGLTASNYQELPQLYEKYGEEGLEILAFPCNQFGAQEPGSNAEIQKFAKARGAEFPVFSKIDVNGDAEHPLYTYLKSEKGELGGNDIKWNFSKFLVDAEGKPTGRYAPTTSPLAIEDDIKKLL